MKKRLLACLLTAAMLTSLFPLPALAAEAERPEWMVTAFDPLDGDTAAQIVPQGGEPVLPDSLTAWAYVIEDDTAVIPPTERLAQEDEQLPSDSTGEPSTPDVTLVSRTAENTLEPAEKQEPVIQSVTIPVVTWEAQPEFDPNAPGEYVYTPVLPAAYEVDREVEPPTITVTVTAAEQTALQWVQAMIDALPAPEDITADNRDEVEAQLETIGAAWNELTDDEALRLDTTRLDEVMSALAALDGQTGNDLPTPLADNAITGSSTADDILLLFNNSVTVSGNTITLTSDTTVNSTIVFESGTWTLNLGGYTLFGKDGEISVSGYGRTGGAPITVTGGSLTVEGDGMLQGGNGQASREAGGAGGAGMTVEGGTVTIQSGNFSGGNASAGTTYGEPGGAGLSVSGGTVTVNGGTFNGGNGTGSDPGGEGVSVTRGGQATINGGAFCCGADKTGALRGGILYCMGGTVILNINLTVGNGQYLNIFKGWGYDGVLQIGESATLTVEDGRTVNNCGKITGSGKIDGAGEIIGNGTIDSTITIRNQKGSKVTIIFSTSNAAEYGATITITATVGKAVTSNALTRAAETDQVEFFRNGNSLGTAPVSDGTATLNNVTLSADNGWTPKGYTITAKFGGSSNLREATGEATLTVTKATQIAPTVGVRESTAKSLTLSASGNGKTALEYACVAGNNVTAPDSGWQANTTFNNLNPGTAYTAFARYRGEAYYELSPAASLTAYTAPEITGSLPNGTVGVAYNQTLTAAAQDSVTWAITSGTLPAGLTLAPDTGTISGAPTKAGRFTLTFQAAANGVGSTKTMDLTINAGTPSITLAVKNGNNVTDTFIYGDTITVEGKIAIPGSSTSNRNALAAPAKNQAALFFGNTQLTEPVPVASNGSFTLTYGTNSGGIPVGSQNLTVKYGGSDDLNEGEQTVAVTLNQRPLTDAAVTVSDGPFIYNGNAQNPNVEVTLDGKTLNDTDYTLSYENTNGGAGNLTNAGTVTVTVTGKGNYNGEADTKPTFTIAPKSITGSVNISGAAEMGATLTARYTENAETVDYQWYQGNTLISGEIGTTYTIVAADVGQSIKVKVTGTGNYAGEKESTPTAAVGKATPSVTKWPTSGAITYGQSLSDSTLQGGQASVPGAFTWEDGTIKPTVADSGKTQYDVTFTPTEDGCYTPVTGQVTLTVNKAARTITVSGTANGPTQVTLNDAVIEPDGTGGTVTYGVSATNTTPTTWQEEKEFSGLTADTTYYFFAKVEASGNYAEAVSAGVAISTPAKAVSSIAIASQPTKLSYTTGQTLDLSGLSVTVQHNDGTSDRITWSESKLTADPAAGTALTVTGHNGKSVTISYGGHSATTNPLTVIKGTQATLTIEAVGDKTYGDSAFTLATTGGSGSGAVSFTSSDPSVLEISGNTAAIKGAGPVIITATKAADGNYNETPATLSLNIGKRPLTVKADDKTVVKGGKIPDLTYTATGLAEGDSFTGPKIETTAQDTNTTGTYDITVSGGTLTNPGGYDVSYKNGTLTVTEKIIPSLTLTATPTSLSGSGTVELTVGGLPDGGTVTVTCSDSSITPTGNGAKWTAALPNRTADYTFTAEYSGDNEHERVTADCTVKVTQYSSGGGGNSGGSGNGGGYIPPSTPTYPPTVKKPSGGGGTPTVTPSNPKQGDTVTVKPRPDEGYEVDNITVTDKNGKPVEVTVKPDGTYTFKQPNGKVTIEMTYQPIDRPWNNPFTDVSEGDWYYEAVRFVQERGLMTGYEDGRFGPNDNLSRAQLAQILFNKEGRPGVNYLLTFSDVAGEAWYTEAIRWATSQGIVSGYGNGTFGPNDPITREQLAVMLWRYSGSPAATNKELHFNDESEISGFALEALRWAVENGILNGYGDGRLGPQGQATRAQVAQMLKNFIENQENKNST